MLWRGGPFPVTLAPMQPAYLPVFFQRLRHGPWVPPEVGRGPFLWLLSVNFFFWKYFVALPGPIEALAVLVTLPVFLVAFFVSFWRTPRRIVACIAIVCALGALWAPYNVGSCTFFIFACGMCAGFLDKRAGYRALAVVLALIVLQALALHGEYRLSFLLPALMVGLPVGLGGIMEAEVKRSRRHLLQKQEEVEHLATIAERERISRDLHDLLGHTLSLITLKAELAGKLVQRDAAAAASEIRDIEQTARQALSEVRSAVTGYRQAGFAYELDGARHSLAAANITLTAAVQPLVLPPAAENVMSLALREAVTNIVRHARAATRCEVSLGVEHGMIVLRIADDGGVADAAAIKAGNGLSGMRERVAALGGRLAMHGGRGLELELMLPLGAGA